MTQAKLAERTGRPLKAIQDIIKGTEPITQETALQLEQALGIPARFWINRESHYRGYLAHQEESNRLPSQGRCGRRANDGSKRIPAPQTKPIARKRRAVPNPQRSNRNSVFTSPFLLPFTLFHFSLYTL